MDACITAGIDVYYSGRDVTVAIYNSTIVANASSPSLEDAGLRFIGTNLHLESTIIAGKVAGAPTPAELDTTMATNVSGANNLVGFATGPIPPDTLLGVGALLGPLANYGGVTPTYSLLTGSSAIDAGKNVFGAAFDQRGMGFVRLNGSAVDIGAIEFDGIVSNGSTDRTRGGDDRRNHTRRGIRIAADGCLRRRDSIDLPQLVA